MNNNGKNDFIDVYVLKTLNEIKQKVKWAINLEEDLIEMDNFIKDCLRVCMIRDKKKHKSSYSADCVGGLGSVDNLPDKTITRGPGYLVATSKKRTDKEIKGYKSLNCMSKNYKCGKAVYSAVLRGL